MPNDLFPTWDSMWDMATGKETSKLKRHTQEVLSVAISPDGKTNVSGSCDNTVR